MKVIKFFCLIGLVTVFSSVLIQNVAVDSSFFQKYLDQTLEEVADVGVLTTDLPSEVINGLKKSPYKDLNIREIKKVEKTSGILSLGWVDKVFPHTLSAPQIHYIISLSKDERCTAVTKIYLDNSGKILETIDI